MKEFCRSCAMPLTEAELGTKADGAASQSYCKYCYQGGKYTQDCTMEERIAFCAPMTAQAMGITPEKATEQMQQFFPKLERWQ